MVPIKDFGTLIKAFAPITTTFPQACLWIAGGGDDHYRQELQLLIDNLGIGNKVSLLGSRRDVSELMSACDLFVLPSITEAASMTILEAMSAGRPVIATRTGGNPELVIHGETGLLVGVGDAAALSESLQRLLSDPVLRNRMGDAGHHWVYDSFSMQHILNQYRQIYLDAGINSAKKK